LEGGRQERRGSYLQTDRQRLGSGHSTRPIGGFIRLLEETGIDFVADVRRVPKSCFNPQFNADALTKALAAHSIGYCRIPELGGLRPNGFWENENFKSCAILGDGKLEPARMTEAAVVGRDGVITYPPVQASLF
jgi:hypothetical protein